MSLSKILCYLADAYRTNPDAEVSGLELEHELGLDKVVIARAVERLAKDGLVKWDPLLNNVWLTITDKGVAQAERQGSRRFAGS